MYQDIPAIVGDLEPRKIYPVTEDELKILKSGSDSSIYLNFAIAILSISFSALFVTLTVENLPVRTQAFIDVFTVIGFFIGAILLFLWKKKDNGMQGIIEKIELRIKADKEKADRLVLKETSKLVV